MAKAKKKKTRKVWDARDQHLVIKEARRIKERSHSPISDLNLCRQAQLVLDPTKHRVMHGLSSHYKWFIDGVHAKVYIPNPLLITPRLIPEEEEEPLFEQTVSMLHGLLEYFKEQAPHTMAMQGRLNSLERTLQAQSQLLQTQSQLLERVLKQQAKIFESLGEPMLPS